jgi:2'-5' RNA ligase
MTQYHLWLTPSRDASERFARLMTQLREQYRGPKFEPHITLLGEIEGEELTVVQHVRTLATKLHPIQIHLQEPAFEDEYFRCLYFTVRPTPEVCEAHEQAKAVFGKIPKSPFHPHVSLLYGLFPERVKREVIVSLPADLPKTFLANDLKLIRAESLNLKDWSEVETLSLEG